MIGTKLADRYELLSELGRGGMATVYRARDPRLDREVAVKMIAAERLAGGVAERFEREAKLVASLDHPSIVPIYDFGRHRRWLFLVMPVLRGFNVHQLLRQQRLVLDTTLEIIARCAEALAYSAAQGIVHRDVKPENIMVTLDEDDRLSRLWVMDFGLAVGDASTRLTRTGNLPGTLAYLSPEQIVTGEVDGRSDLYSLGVILYECLAGRTPFSGSPASVLYRIVNEEPPSLLPHGVDERLDAVVMSCLRKRPEERLSCGDELARQLREQAQLLLPGAPRRLPRPSQQEPEDDLPLIGRDEQLEQIEQILDRTLDGACQMVLCGGERGFGNSRLGREAAGLARRRGFQVLRGRFAGHTGGGAYGGFGELILDCYTQHKSSTSLGSLDIPDLDDLASDLLTLFPDLAEIPELLEARQRGLSWRGPDAEAQLPKEQRTIFELIARTLRRLAGDRPQALIIEHLQNADASVQLLLYLVRRLGPTRTMIFGTYRPSGTPRNHPLSRLLRGLAADPRCHQVVLEPLSKGDHRQLLEHLLGGGELDTAVADHLYEVTEGNPLFAQEVVRSLWDGGDLQLDSSGHWRLLDPRPLDRELPESIQQAISLRIERLGEEHLEVLGVAAVLGHGCRYRELEQLCGDGEELEDAVDTLISRGLLREVPRTRGEQLVFGSGLVREVVYSRLPRRRRRRLHRRIGELLEGHAGEDRRSSAALLHHFSEGDVAEKAVVYGTLYAQKALSEHSWDDVKRACSLALEFIDEAGEAAGELRLLLARAQAGRGQADAALREAARAVDAFQRGGKIAAAAGAVATLVEVAWKNRRMNEVSRWLDTGIALARTATAPDTLAQLLRLAATAANLRGEHARARRFLDEVAELEGSSRATSVDALAGGRVLRVGLLGPVTTQDPAVATSVQEAELLANLFEPLYAVAPDGSALPRLARSLSSSEDLCTYHVQLREGRRFSEGTPVSAEAVKRSIEQSGRLGARRLRPLISGLVGGEAFLREEASGIEGLTVTAELELRLALVGPMPLLPALLSTLGMSIALRRDGEIYGTGPFVLEEQEAERWRLTPHPDHREHVRPAGIDFHFERSSRDIAAGLLDGRLDLGRDLSAPEVSDFMARPTFQRSIHEVPLPNTAALLLNRGGPATRDPRLRRLLMGVLDPHVLVWNHLGRFALPAGSWIPPGVLGHDPDSPGHRRLDRFEAVGRLQDLDPAPVSLRALVHPIFRHRFRAVLEAIAAEWSLLGLTLDVEELPLSDHGQLRAAAAETDLVLTRWYPDYPDPDAYFSHVFSATGGLYGDYVASAETEKLLEKARLATGPSQRERLYRRLQLLLVHEDVMLPLFHEVEFRVSSPTLGDVFLLSNPPYVDYPRVGWRETAPSSADDPRPLGRLRLPMPGPVEHLDPARAVESGSLEALATVFEGLTRIDRRGGIVPHLARSYEALEEGRRFRFRLRKVHFHDGRRLRVQDVRYTLMRLLRHASHGLARRLEELEGAAAYQAGRTEELSGFLISDDETFDLVLRRPMGHFPAYLSDPTLSIVPEGSSDFSGTWREGCVGTGPFRVADFEPGRRLELAAHERYWRPGRPRCHSLVFERQRTGSSPAAELKEGRLHLVRDLPAADVDDFAQDARFAGGVVEHPAFATFFLLFNRVQGPLADIEVRRRLCRHVGDCLAAAEEHIGRLGVVASGLIPPGLLSHTHKLPPAWASSPPEPFDGLRLETAVNPLIVDQHAAFWRALCRHLAQRGVELRVISTDLESMLEGARLRSVDVIAGRWQAEVPDPSSFAGIVHSDDEGYGRLVCHERIDRLVERGESELDPTARRVAYEELERQLAKEALLCPLFHQQICCVAHPDVEGLRLGYSWPPIPYDELSLRR